MGANKLIEQRPEVHHGLPKILRARLTATVTDDDIAAGAVVVHHGGVLNREIVEAVGRILDRIPARSHDVLNEPVCFVHGRARVINESRLNRTPARREPIDVFARKRSQRERLDSVLPLEQLTLDFRRRLGRLQKTVVLRTETRSQHSGLAPLHEQPHRDRHQGRDNDDREPHLHLVIHGSPRPLP
jgi:hypothetical protein